MHRIRRKLMQDFAKLAADAIADSPDARWFGQWSAICRRDLRAPSQACFEIARWRRGDSIKPSKDREVRWGEGNDGHLQM
jgi:hypothetical protein